MLRRQRFLSWRGVLLILLGIKRYRLAAPSHHGSDADEGGEGGEGGDQENELPGGKIG